MNFTSLKTLVVLALGVSTMAAARPSISFELDIVDSVVERVVDMFAPAHASASVNEMTLIPGDVQIVQSDGSIAVVNPDIAEWAYDEDFETMGADVAGYLNAHNQYRSKHGAHSLTWDNNLQAKAQQWANGCKFKHSGGTLGPYGENLAAGTGNYPASKAVEAWYNEVGDYNPGNPKPSHFTQVVWKSTQRVGCAVTTCGGIFGPNSKAQYHVCEYFPAGNVIGHFPQNVQK